MIWWFLTWSILAVPVAIVVGRRISAAALLAQEAERQRRAAPAVAPAATGSARGEPAPYVEELRAVHLLLARLERHDPVLAKVVLLRWIGGLSVAQTADALETPVERVQHDLLRAQKLLRRDRGIDRLCEPE